MKINKKDIANVLYVIFAIIIFATFLFGIHLTIECCENESRNISQPPYKASYGDFWSIANKHGDFCDENCCELFKAKISISVSEK